VADVGGRLRRGGDGAAAADACESAAHRVRRGGGGGDTIKLPAYTQHTFHLCWCVSRILFFVIYALAVVKIKEARKFCLVYLTGYGISIILTAIVAALAKSSSGISYGAALGLSIAAVVVELATFFAPVLFTSEAERPPIDVEHQIERSELWCILILGESMLSIVATVVPSTDMRLAHGTYGIAILCFTIMYVLMKGYMASQPHAHSGLDTHANDLGLHRTVFHTWFQLPLTFSLFVLGVGLKFCMKYGVENMTYSKAAGSYSPYKERYAWMVSISAGCAMFFMATSRYSHEWSNYTLWNTSVTRKWFRLIAYLIAGAVIPLALMVGTVEVPYPNATVTADDCHRQRLARRGGDAAAASDDCVDGGAGRVRRGGGAAAADAGSELVQSGESALVFLIAVLAIVFVSWLADLFSAPNEETLKELHDFHRAQKMMIATNAANSTEKHPSPGRKSTSHAGAGMDENAASAFKLAAEQSTNRGIRGGGKILRFSDKNMAAAIRQNKEENGKVGTKSLFMSYQKILDKHDPGSHMSSQSILSRQKWQKGGGLAAMMKNGKDGAKKKMSMDGLGMALTKRGSVKVDNLGTVSEGAAGSAGSAGAAFGGPNKRGKRPTKVQVAPEVSPEKKSSTSTV